MLCSSIGYLCIECGLSRKRLGDRCAITFLIQRLTRKKDLPCQTLARTIEFKSSSDIAPARTSRYCRDYCFSNTRQIHSRALIASMKVESFCFCVNYLRLNVVEKWESYQIFHMDRCADSFEELAEFSTLDVNRGYR